MMAAPIVEDKFVISSYETDTAARIKGQYIQNHLQEIAYQGSEFCGCSYEVLRTRGLFWALNRIHFQVLECPKWGDEVILQTWSRGQTGPLWHRNFRMYKAGDMSSPVILGTSAWTLLDLENRSIFRGETGFDESLHYAEDTLPFCTKIAVPRELGQVGEATHTVLFSDLDTNGHANNCQYTQWAMDALPLEYVKSHILRDVQVCYYHEIHAGETVALSVARDGDTWFVTGKVGELQCFVERIEFAAEA
ncbi:MAG: hypothetical protein IJ222_03175 [Bacteroidales bacterium]|nr:hypothetical protein [Bacteroidales bacterium]